MGKNDLLYRCNNIGKNTAGSQLVINRFMQSKHICKVDIRFTGTALKCEFLRKRFFVQLNLRLCTYGTASQGPRIKPRIELFKDQPLQRLDQLALINVFHEKLVNCPANGIDERLIAFSDYIAHG